MILMIDNYDSFTYNLVQYLMMLNEEVKVVRNDAVTTDDVAAMNADCVVVSPGPCTPQEAGISVPFIQQYSGKIPILGVCLGHQSIGAAFGGNVIKAQRVMHGKVSQIEHNGEGIFDGIKSPLSAIRYHSLAIERASVPECLTITATAEDNEIMSVTHKKHLTVGVQFHPESILTPCGKRLLANFLKMAKADR